MPKRTNEFQKLVSLVQRAFAPKGAKVTDSAMVDVPGQPEQREIDVLIETAGEPYNIKIAVEAKDESRKMDQTRFEALLGKYFTEGSIKVDKLVVVTHRGFYDSVLERAKAFGGRVELLTYHEAENNKWAQLWPKTIQFRIAPHLTGFSFSPPVPDVPIARLLKEGHVYCSHGTCCGSPVDFAKHVLRNHVLPGRPQLFQELNTAAMSHANGQQFAVFNYPISADHEHFLLIDGKTLPLKEFSFAIHVVNSRGKMLYKCCEVTSSKGNDGNVPLGSNEK
jgi:hypothetical protein